MERTMRPIIAIVGGAHAPAPVLAAAEALGCLVVDAGFRVVTGGLTGVMAAASRGGRSAHGWFEGAVLGILPGLDPAAANPWVDVAIATGLNHARNVVVVASADVVVAVGGGAGTLSEIALAWAHGKPVIGLDVGEGWSSRLGGEVLDDRRSEPIRRAQDPEDALAQIVALLAVRPGNEPPPVF
jgi:uncharacterized protein (TIGR00725 family)